MAVTKVSSTQTRNEGLPRILKVDFNTGAGRSTTSSTSLVVVPGATGDTSYTAPSDTNVDIYFTMTHMVNPVTGICRVHLSINGVAQAAGIYAEPAGGNLSWPCMSVPYKVSVDAGQTITIGCMWSQSAGTVTMTNAAGDSSFANEIVGLVIPRPS